MSEIDFTDIRAQCLAGATQREVAAKYGISRSYVSDIVCGRSGWHPDADAKVQQLKDQRTYARSRLRKSLKAEYLFQEAANVAASYIKPLKPSKVPRPPKPKKAIEETAVLILSDGHHDQVVRPEEVDGHESYNFDISLRRAQVLTDATIKFTQRTLANYRYDRLVILSLGDNTGGEIHDAEKRSAFGNQFKNTLAIGALHAAIFRDFAAHFEHVEVHCVSGNHGRRTPTKEYAGGADNNWDWLCNKIAQRYCSDLPNVSITVPGSFSHLVDVEGYTFHISHGDDIAGTSGNPWNGLRKRHERQSGIHPRPRKGKPVLQNVDYYCIGHHHTRGTVNGNGVGFICNGAWLSTDQFAFQKLGVAGPPEQLLFGVNKNVGITWQLPLLLDGADDSKVCRYDYIKDLLHE